MKNTKSKVAVGYLRRSTTKQEASLDKQREVIEQHAAQLGYSILRYYTDDGISGASGAHRPGFQEMIAKAENGKDFDCIICYDVSRFGRMDNDEVGYYRHKLRMAGVEVITVMESDRYANPDTAEILRPIEQIQHRAYLKKVSADVLGGMKKTASDGHWGGGDAPFGFKRVICDAQRNILGELEGGATLARRQGGHVELRPQPTEVPTVQWLFSEYASTRRGYKSLAYELNDRGVRTRNGNPWGPTTI